VAVTPPAVFAFSALIAISAGGLAMSSSAVVVRDKVQQHEGSTGAMKDGTQATTVRFSRKRPPRTYAESNQQPAAGNQGNK
jgi:hypothetical protein